MHASSVPERSSTLNVPKHAVYQTLYSPAGCRTGDIVLTGNRLPENAAPLPHTPDSAETNWLHFVGVNDGGILKTLLAPYGIHELVIEDILNRSQRPKVEDYESYLFITARVFQYQNNKLVSDPVFLITGRNFVLTFQQRPLGLLSSVRRQLEDNAASLRGKGPAFLTYTFIDRIIDDYFITLDHYNDRVETIDKNLFANTGGSTGDLLPKIHRLRRDAARLRRTLWPVRDVLGQLLRGDFPVFRHEARIYLRDAYDHTLQLTESLDAARDSVQSMMDIHLSFQSNRLNLQMRVLTVITILFMPLTLITGIYGMNFENMPELRWRYGYFAVLALMAVIISGLLLFFHRRKWI